MPDQLADVKRRGLEVRLAAVQEEYAAVNDQISCTLSDADGLKLRRQAKALEHEMSNLEQELAAIVESQRAASSPGQTFGVTDRTDLSRRTREALADCYLDRATAEVLAATSGLSLVKIDLSGAPIVFWQRVLEEAEREGRVMALLDEAIAWAPGRLDLRTLREEYRQWQETSQQTPDAPAPAAGPAVPQAPAADWDVFISHAWEDKEAIARPLAKALEAKGLRVWFDEFTLSVGDRLRRSIDKGLACCKYGIVILSPTFFAKEWPQKELDGLIQRENKGEKVILPVWHNISAGQIAGYSPSLADRIGVRSDVGLERVVAELLRGMGISTAAPKVAPIPALSGDLQIIGSPIHLELVRIPAGEFLMGSDPQLDQSAVANEQPQHRVNLAEYYIGKYPITVAQYADFAGAVGRKVSEAPGRADHPVTEVSWDDAVAFCRWLSERSGRAFRLPSEAEWEKAARGTDGWIYPWGNQKPDGTLCNYGVLRGATTPVSRYPAGASPYGALDMAGNVWEWTSSLFKPYPYRAEDGREDQKVREARVLRGGAFYDDARNVRCACRYRNLPDGRNWDLGFRVVESPHHS